MCVLGVAYNIIFSECQNMQNKGHVRMSNTTKAQVEVSLLDHLSEHSGPDSYIKI